MLISDRRIRFRHLVCFLEVANLNRVKAAAESLNMAESAVSRALSELDEVTGVRLLERSRRGSFLTKAGERFYRYAAPGVAQLRAAYRTANPLSGEKLKIVIGTLPSASPLLSQTLPRMRESAPDVELRVLQYTNAIGTSLLRQGELSLMIGRIPEPDQLIGLTFEHLYSEPICCVVKKHHPLTKRLRLTPDDFKTMRIVIHQPAANLRKELDRYLYAKGVSELNDIIETDSVLLGRQLVIDDARVWFVAYGSVRADLATGECVELPIVDWSTSGSVGITINPKMKPTQAEDVLLSIIRETASGVNDSQ